MESTVRRAQSGPQSYLILERERERERDRSLDLGRPRCALLSPLGISLYCMGRRNEGKRPPHRGRHGMQDGPIPGPSCGWKSPSDFSWELQSPPLSLTVRGRTMHPYIIFSMANLHATIGRLQKYVIRSPTGSTVKWDRRSTHKTAYACPRTYVNKW